MKQPSLSGRVTTHSLYCGCVWQEHQSNLSCFVDKFGPDGNPMWTDHPFTCAVCVRIARETMLLSSQGKSLKDVRSMIDDHYGHGFGEPTMTPLAR